MGRKGPIPKRTDEVMGHRTKAELAERETFSGTGQAIDVPEPDPEWHPIATRWYESLAKSGQHQFYEPSDWAVAVYVAEVMSRTLHRSYASANQYSFLLAGATELLSTEGSRRRLRLELQKHHITPENSAGVTAINEYKRRITG